MEGYGKGEKNIARWQELKWVMEEREYLYEDKGYQSQLDEIAYSLSYIFDSKEVRYIDMNAKSFWMNVVDTLGSKDLQSREIKSAKMAEKLLNCLQGEYPRCVRKAVKARKKIEREMAKFEKRHAPLKRIANQMREEELAQSSFNRA